jgi:endonuclease YncB( thermonuclease family)
MRVKVWGTALALLLAGTAAGLLPIGGSDVEARVVGVSDGDTLTVRVGPLAEEKVRLVEIDAPERGQPYGAAARQQLSAMVQGRTVRLRREGRDRYGRTLARGYAGGDDVNKAMVRSGAAWVYDAYSTDPSFEPLETAARTEKAGLWALQEDQVTPPWAWRRGEGRGGAPELTRVSEQRRLPAPSPEPAETSTPSSAPQCGSRRTCGEMKSCEEARFHLAQCGLSGLDRDKDGVPCEALCGG